MTTGPSKDHLHDGLDLAVTGRTLSIALLRAREAVMERFRPFLTEHGVTEQQWRVMRVLREAGPCDAKRLAEMSCVLAPSLSRITKALEARGFLRMPKDKADGRRSIVELTEAGDAFLRALTPQSAKAYAEIEERVGRAEIDALLDDLNRLLVKLSESEDLK